MMIELAEVYDINVPVMETKAYVEAARQAMEVRGKTLSDAMEKLRRESEAKRA